MVQVSDIIKTANSEIGSNTILWGFEKKDPARLPFGVFVVDFATGGGMPIYGTTCLWGPDSGGKTTLAMNAVAMCSRICWRCFNLLSDCECSQKPIRMKSAWADSEGTFDREWAERVGCDPNGFIMINGETGEQYLDLAESVLRADDIGLLVIDGLAALIPEAEMTASFADQFIGNQAKLVTRGVRKLKQRLIREMKRGHPCTILVTNQMRVKIGQMFGDPEIMPGGYAAKHEMSLLLRLVKKALARDGVDKKFFDSRTKTASASRHSFAIRKEKVLTLHGVGEFRRCTAYMPEFNYTQGEVIEYATMMKLAKMYGVVSKADGGGWMYFGHKAKTLEHIQDVWKKIPAEKFKTSKEIIRIAKEKRSGHKKIREAE